MQPVSTRLTSPLRPAFSISSLSVSLKSWLWEEMQAPPPQTSTSSRFFMPSSLAYSLTSMMAAETGLPLTRCSATMRRASSPSTWP